MARGAVPRHVPTPIISRRIADVEPRAHHVLIGIFTVATVAAILVFALWLGDASQNREYRYYEVGFQQGVSGLSEGSPVQYSGIDVGDVVSLRLNPDDPREVRALIRVYEDIPIRENTRASLNLANITGSMIIQLFGGTPDSPILKGSRDNPPLIVAEPSQFSALMANSESLFEKADEFLTNANRLLSEENADNLSATLVNLRTVSEALVAERETVNKALTSVYDAATQAEATFARYDRLGDQVESLLEEDGKALMVSAREAAESLSRATDRLDQLVETNEGSLDQGLQSIGELGPIMEQLQSTLGNLNRLTRRLEEDPGRALLGKDPVQEVEP